MSACNVYVKPFTKNPTAVAVDLDDLSLIVSVGNLHLLLVPHRKSAQTNKNRSEFRNAMPINPSNLIIRTNRLECTWSNRI